MINFVACQIGLLALSYGASTDREKRLIIVLYCTVVEYGCKYLEQSVSPKSHLVVEAYEHALLAKFPNNRYAVGNDSKFIYMPLSFLPFHIQVSDSV